MASRNAVLFTAQVVGYCGDFDNEFRVLRALVLATCLTGQKLVTVIACAVCNTLLTSSSCANLCPAW